MSKEVLAAGLAAAAAAISASPKARRAIRDAGLDAADVASQAAGRMTQSATKLGSLIAEAVADAAQRVVSGDSSSVDRESSSGRIVSRKAAKRLPRTTVTPKSWNWSSAEHQLVREVEAMVARSGAPENFDAAEWVHNWVRQEVPALGHKRPLDLLRTKHGRRLISATLARMQSGAYA